MTTNPAEEGLWGPLPWFIGDVAQGINNTAKGWFGSIGGSIASGMEAGFVSFFKDLWKSIEGVVWVSIGVTIVIITLLIYFREPANAAIAKSIGTVARAMI